MSFCEIGSRITDPTLSSDIYIFHQSHLFKLSIYEESQSCFTSHEPWVLRKQLYFFALCDFVTLNMTIDNPFIVLGSTEAIRM